MKVCKTCGETKPSEEFRPSKGMKDGHRSACKRCEYRYSVEWRKANPEKVKASYQARCARSFSGEPIGVKVCNICKEEKSLEEFASRPDAPDKKDYLCKVCANQKSRQWQKEHRAEIRGRHLARAYGLPAAFQDKMLKEQNNSCGICRAVFHKTPYVDHDHCSGKARGLLCLACNSLLGFARDNKTILQRAIDYLSLFEPTNNKTKKEKTE